MAENLRPNQAVQIYQDVYGGQKMVINHVLRAPKQTVVTLEILEASVDNHFFVAREICRVKAITLIPRVAGTGAGTTVLTVTRCQGTEAPNGGDNLLQSTLNLEGSVDTVQNGTLTGTDADLILAVGDRLAVDYTKTAMTSVVANLSVELETMAGVADNILFTAQRICKVTAIDYTPLVKGTDSSAVTLMVDRCQGVEAPGAGDNLMSAVFNLKSTIHVVQNGALTTTAAHRILAIGDRIALDITGSPTDVAGAVTVELEMMAQAGSLPK